MSSRPSLKVGLYIIGLAYFYGALLGGLSLTGQVLFQAGLPSLAWWQWLLAPLGIGFAAMGVEWLVEKLQLSTGFGGHNQSKPKRALHLALLVVALAALIIGLAMYKAANQ